MALGSYDPFNRYRNRALQRVNNLFATVLIIVMSVASGFWLGRQFGAESVISLKEQVQTLTQQNTELQDSVTGLRAEAQTANTRYEQMRQQYNEQIPEGPMQDLTNLVHEQI